MEQTKYDECIESSDWRNSATIIGLMRYFNYFDIDYNKEEIMSKREWDNLRFNKADITEDRYLEYVEATYTEDMHHKVVENILSNENISEENIKLINEKISANTIMKQCFGKLRFNGENKEDILNVIVNNRNEIIKETFRNKLNLYKNFCNKDFLFRETKDCCKLKGYYIDFSRKGKSASYNFDMSTYVSTDNQYYDFIPFGFLIGNVSYFINSSNSIADLWNSNEILRRESEKAKGESYNKNNKKVFFQTIITSSDFIDYDVEVIKKDSNEDYFETIILRKKSINILKNINNHNIYCISIKDKSGNYINVQEKVTSAIINLTLLDNLIELLLKEDCADKELRGRNYNLIYNLIILNEKIRGTMEKIYGGISMETSMKSAYACAGQVVKELIKQNQENKLRSYRTKLTSAIVFKDYDRFCEILLNLANATNTHFNFAYDLFEDFEGNKDLAYAFINALVEKKDFNSKNVQEEKE